MSSKSSLGVRTRNGNFFNKASRRRVDLRFHKASTERDVTVQTRIWGDRRDGIMTSAEVRQTTPPPWSEMQRPTHFVAMKLPKHSATMMAVERLHVDTEQAYSKYMPLFVPREKLHLTLSVVTLTDPETQLKKLNDIVTEAAPLLRKTTLHFDGLGTFGRGRVLWREASVRMR